MQQQQRPAQPAVANDPQQQAREMLDQQLTAVNEQISLLERARQAAAAAGQVNPADQQQLDLLNQQKGGLMARLAEMVRPADPNQPAAQGGEIDQSRIAELQTQLTEREKQEQIREANHQKRMKEAQGLLAANQAEEPKNANAPAPVPDKGDLGKVSKLLGNKYFQAAAAGGVLIGLAKGASTGSTAAAGNDAGEATFYVLLAVAAIAAAIAAHQSLKSGSHYLTRASNLLKSVFGDKADPTKTDTAKQTTKPSWVSPKPSPGASQAVEDDEATAAASTAPRPVPSGVRT